MMNIKSFGDYYYYYYALDFRGVCLAIIYHREKFSAFYPGNGTDANIKEVNMSLKRWPLCVIYRSSRREISLR